MHMPRRPGTPGSVTGRVLAILNVFDPGDRLTLVEISEQAGLPLSTTFRLVAELVDGRMLAREDDRRYRIGPRVRELAAQWSAGTLAG